MDSMTSLDIKPCDELRRALSKAMKPDTMCVEDLPSFLGSRRLILYGVQNNVSVRSSNSFQSENGLG